MSYSYGGQGDRRIPNRLLDELLKLIEAKQEKGRQVRPALVGQGCDGLETYNVLGTAGDLCGVQTAGNIVLVGLVNGVPQKISGRAARPYAGTARGTPAVVAVGENFDPGRGRKFADSAGNLYDYNGVYLGDWDEDAADALGVTYAAVAKNGRCGYEEPSIEDAIVYFFALDATAGSTSVRVNESVTCDGILYPGGLSGMLYWIDPAFTGYNHYPGDPAAVGLGTVDGPPRRYKTDHVILCVEAGITTGGDGFVNLGNPTKGYGLTVRRLDNIATVMAEERLDTLPGVFGTGAQLSSAIHSGSGASTTYPRNQWHVSAAPDGAWWVHDAGNPSLVRVVYDQGTETVSVTERVNLTGATFNGRMLAKQVK